MATNAATNAATDAGLKEDVPMALAKVIGSKRREFFASAALTPIARPTVPTATTATTAPTAPRSGGASQLPETTAAVDPTASVSQLARVFRVSEDQVMSLRKTAGNLYSLVDICRMLTQKCANFAAQQIRIVMARHPEVSHPRSRWVKGK